MDEKEFNTCADMALRRIEDAIDRCGADVDIEMKPGGVVELEFADGSKVIINRHAAAREIWVAAKSGGYHFRYADGQWLDTRSGDELMKALSVQVSRQAGQTVDLA